jgi:tyrosinase
MKISTLTVALLIGSVSAFFQEHDVLAAKGLEKLAVHVARNGYPNPEKCTLKNVSVRREW